jgi:integrase
MKAVDEVPMTPENRERVKACMRLQREAGLAIVDAVGLSKDELTKEEGRFRVKTSRQKTGASVNNPITEELGQLLLKVKNGNPKYFFASGNTLPEDAPSYFQKLYRKVFKKAGVGHTSHDLRHTYAATFLEAGGDIRLLTESGRWRGLLLLIGQHDRNPVTTRHEKRSHASHLFAEARPA